MGSGGCYERWDEIEEIEAGAEDRHDLRIHVAEKLVPTDGLRTCIFVS